jgi:outer membrane protein OmpA-like peptidoglycan-associated protein
VALCAARAFAGSPGIDAEQFHPAITGDSFFGVDGAFVNPHLTLTGGAWLNYGHAPLIVERGGKSSDVIASQLGLDLALTLGIVDRLEIGILLPATFNAQHDNSLLDLKGGLDGAGLGDLTLDLKATVLNAHAHGHRIGLAIAASVSAPTGDAANFSSQGGWTGHPRVAFEWRAPHDWVGIGLSFGAVLRSERDLGQLSVTHQLSYGLGLRVNATHGLTALAEVRGLAGVGLPSSVNFTTAEAPLEADLGLRWRSSFGLQMEVAGGFGLTRGYGTPDGRVIFGLRYYAALKKKPSEEVVLDHDNDGVPDDFDRCPNLAGPIENHGCPVADLDGDGVDDSLDKCPNERGPVENHGCPEFDSDQDGVPDRLDKCPEMPGPKEKQGCPDDDRDHDGIPDAKDRCPDQPGPAANDGCPDVDSDGDGIVDRLDKCPFDPEVFNGVADDDGCPDPGPALAELLEDRIVLKEPIMFGSKNRIEPKSHRVLGVVAKLLELHPEIRKVRIEGHTDDKGSAIDNLDLSRERAAAVRRHLIDIGGVDGKRLVAQGFGPDRPIADNKTEAGRAKNRRIELVIIEKAPAP